MNFTLHQLQVFIKVVELESITKAAEALFISQPAASIQLKNFQDQFAFPLTEVINKKIYITDFGKEIAESVRHILYDVEKIKNKSNVLQGHLHGKLKLSVVSTAKYIIPYLISSFLKKYPEVELVLDVTNKQTVESHLYKNDIDFAFVSILPENLKLKSIEILDNVMYLVGNNDFEIKRINDWSKFDLLPLIFREKGSATRATMKKYLEDNKIPYHTKLELTSNEAVKQAILAGLGISIMPLIGLKNELKLNQIKIIPAKGLPIQTKWQLIWHKEKMLSPTAEAYLDYINENHAKIIKEHFDWIH
jgi:LysR family transcriptional regulator, low CO2-responsive transcriptional regulator